MIAYMEARTTHQCEPQTARAVGDRPVVFAKVRDPAMPSCRTVVLGSSVLWRFPPGPLW